MMSKKKLNQTSCKDRFVPKDIIKTLKIISLEGKNISSNHRFEKNLKFRHTENSVTQSNLFLKWTKDIGRYFCKCTYNQQAWERCPASLVIVRQVQITTQVSSQICFHHLGWLCLYEMKRISYWGCGATGAFFHC